MNPTERLLSFVPRRTAMEGHGANVRIGSRRPLLVAAALTFPSSTPPSPERPWGEVAASASSTGKGGEHRAPPHGSTMSSQPPSGSSSSEPTRRLNGFDMPR
jgi:hypothetical protein